MNADTVYLILNIHISAKELLRYECRCIFIIIVFTQCSLSSLNWELVSGFISSSSMLLSSCFFPFSYPTGINYVWTPSRVLDSEPYTHIGSQQCLGGFGVPLLRLTVCSTGLLSGGYHGLSACGLSLLGVVSKLVLWQLYSTLFAIIGTWVLWLPFSLLAMRSYTVGSTGVIKQRVHPSTCNNVRFTELIKLSLSMQWRHVEGVEVGWVVTHTGHFSSPLPPKGKNPHIEWAWVGPTVSLICFWGEKSPFPCLDHTSWLLLTAIPAVMS